MTMSAIRCRELAALAEACATGPWISDARDVAGKHWDTIIRDAKRQPIASFFEAGWSKAEQGRSAAFIAAARTAVPALCATVDALVEALRHCVEEHDCDEAAAILATYTPPADEPGKE